MDDLGKVRAVNLPSGDVYLDEPWVSIRWDTAHRYVRTEWKGFATSVEFREALSRALMAITQRKALACLIDFRNVKFIANADMDWVNDSWIPLVVQAGLRRFALVRTAGGLRRLVVDGLMRRCEDQDLLIRGFDSLDEATNWLAAG